MQTFSLRGRFSTHFFPSGYGKPLLNLLGQSWPIALTTLNLAFFNFVSTPFIGRIGETEMAALGKYLLVEAVMVKVVILVVAVVI